MGMREVENDEQDESVRFDASASFLEAKHGIGFRQIVGVYWSGTKNRSFDILLRRLHNSFQVGSFDRISSLIFSLFKTRSRKFRHLKKLECLVAACSYIDAKLSDESITLRDIADKLQFALRHCKHLGAWVKYVCYKLGIARLPPISPRCFFDRLILQLFAVLACPFNETYKRKSSSSSAGWAKGAHNGFPEEDGRRSAEYYLSLILDASSADTSCISDGNDLQEECDTTAACSKDRGDLRCWEEETFGVDKAVGNVCSSSEDDSEIYSWDSLADSAQTIAHFDENPKNDQHKEAKKTTSGDECMDSPQYEHLTSNFFDSVVSDNGESIKERFYHFSRQKISSSIFKDDAGGNSISINLTAQQLSNIEMRLSKLRYKVAEEAFRLWKVGNLVLLTKDEDPIKFLEGKEKGDEVLESGWRSHGYCRAATLSACLSIALACNEFMKFSYPPQEISLAMQIFLPQWVVSRIANASNITVYRRKKKILSSIYRCFSEENAENANPSNFTDYLCKALSSDKAVEQISRLLARHLGMNVSCHAPSIKLNQFIRGKELRKRAAVIPRETFKSMCLVEDLKGAVRSSKKSAIYPISSEENDAYFANQRTIRDSRRCSALPKSYSTFLEARIAKKLKNCIHVGFYSGSSTMKYLPAFAGESHIDENINEDLLIQRHNNPNDFVGCVENHRGIADLQESASILGSAVLFDDNIQKNAGSEKSLHECGVMASSYCTAIPDFSDGEISASMPSKMHQKCLSHSDSFEGFPKDIFSFTLESAATENLAVTFAENQFNESAFVNFAQVERTVLSQSLMQDIESLVHSPANSTSQSSPSQEDSSLNFALKAPAESDITADSIYDLAKQTSLKLARSDTENLNVKRIYGIQYETTRNRWVCKWTNSVGKMKRKCFSVNVYGNAVANALAVDFMKTLYADMLTASVM